MSLSSLGQLSKVGVGGESGLRDVKVWVGVEEITIHGLPLGIVSFAHHISSLPFPSFLHTLKVRWCSMLSGRVCPCCRLARKQRKCMVFAPLHADPRTFRAACVAVWERAVELGAGSLSSVSALSTDFVRAAAKMEFSIHAQAANRTACGPPLFLPKGEYSRQLEQFVREGRASDSGALDRIPSRRSTAVARPIHGGNDCPAV